MPARRAPLVGSLVFATLLGGFAAAAAAAPLDLSDPTPRTVQVQFELSWNPLTIGQLYSAPIPASYSATGNTGTLVIASADYAAAIATQDLDYFGYMMTWSLVGGSASAFTLHIDLTTHEATAEIATWQIDIQSPVQHVGNVERVLSTTATAGFNIAPQFPNFPFFCVPCIAVAGAPYDPSTGKLNAVGYDDLDAPDVDLRSFSRAGDLRLSETPTPLVPALSGSGAGSLALALAGVGLFALRSLRSSAPGRTHR